MNTLFNKVIGKNVSFIHTLKLNGLFGQHNMVNPYAPVDQSGNIHFDVCFFRVWSCHLLTSKPLLYKTLRRRYFFK